MYTQKKLKVYTKFQRRTYEYIKVPEIRLEGKWLEELGFARGKTVNIKQKKDKLIITVDKG